MILLLDNYDSFTYNLLHYAEQFTDEIIVVKRNDEITVDEAGKFSSIMLSPGPGLPAQSGVMPGIIKAYVSSIPILGICLGHQAIGEYFGGKLQNLEKVLHGVQRSVTVTNKKDRLFTGIPQKFLSGHYHSWVVNAEGLSPEVEITAVDDSGNIMALSHKKFPVSGVQFHPESIMTEHGLKIMQNWLEYCRNRLHSKISL